MERELHSIGRLARASGLTVSALRFYDGAGILVPAVVDPQTGYRWYTEEQLRPARLVAGLRRVGMPLAQIAVAVRDGADPVTVRELLDAHLGRLEAGLADARRELSRIRALLDDEENPMTGVTRLTLRSTELTAALAAVRFAVGTDPELPQLTSILLDVEPEAVRLVTTDRHRLAIAAVPAGVTGTERQVIAPVDLLDEVRARIERGAPAGPEPQVQLLIEADRLTWIVDGDRLTGQALPYDFPDYRRLVSDRADPAPARRVTVDVTALRASLTGTTPFVVTHPELGDLDVTVLRFDERGGLTVLTRPGEPAAGALHVGVNREYLLDALDAGDRGQLVLELDGPITPLAVRRTDDERTFSILMPIRLPTEG